MPQYHTYVLLASSTPQAAAVEEALRQKIRALNLEQAVKILNVPSLGFIPQGTEMMLYPEGLRYGNLTPASVRHIAERHLYRGEPLHELLIPALKVEPLPPPQAKEVRVVLRNVGKIAPDNIEDYIAQDGYAALGKAVTQMTPQQVIDELKISGLRGRGGAGFPTWRKWSFTQHAPGERKYLICNGDEGDPGAFMNRRVLEGDPHAVIEGMAIAAYATGAQNGYIYVRAEYPHAIRALRIAIEQARAYGLLGENIFKPGFTFDLELRMGAGAFVCGEETALMRSIEGERGIPRTRPPYPAIEGLWGAPTNINNVETYANVPQILLRGSAWFAAMGTQKSKGSKTFTIAGKAKHTGLVEVPLGITIREIVYEVGGGIANDKKFKAVQTGGPLGGCIPAQYLDLPVDYESLIQVGSMMGSGGFVVMDEDVCMVDIARFFMEYTQDESCGQCPPCRLGTREMLDILTRICEGLGNAEDLTRLEELAHAVKQGSLCGLGKGAPNPVLSTLKYFRHEYEAHIHDKKCPAKVCRALISYEIAPHCVGCAQCTQHCPVAAISGNLRELHSINKNACVRCGICEQICPVQAISLT